MRAPPWLRIVRGQRLSAGSRRDLWAVLAFGVVMSVSSEPLSPKRHTALCVEVGMVEPETDRFWRRVDKSGECWEWKGRNNWGGYGLFERTITKKRVVAHRYAWQSERGAIPAGLLVCHRCDNRLCVRPDHLFLGTQKDNMRDCWAKGRGKNNRPPSRPECRRGHARTVENTYLSKRGKFVVRVCRVCQREWNRDLYRRKYAKV